MYQWHGPAEDMYVWAHEWRLATCYHLQLMDALRNGSPRMRIIKLGANEAILRELQLMIWDI